MAPAADDVADLRSCTIPEFDFGEDLYVLMLPEGRVEFRTLSPDEFIRADTALTLSDECR